MDISTGIIFGIIAMLSWGTCDFFIVKAVRKSNVLKTVIWSQTIGLILYYIIFSLFFKLPILSPATITIILTTGLLSVIGFLSFCKGLQVGTVSIISPVSACWAVITVILSLVFLNETLTSIQSAGVILAISGTVLTSFKLHDLLKLKLKNHATGIEYAIISVFATGIYFVFISILVNELSWFLPIFFMKNAALFYLLTYSATAKKNISLPKDITSSIILIGTLEAIGFLAYGIGVNSEYTSIVAPISATFPMVTIILAKIFFKETLELNQKIGIISILCGLVLLSI